MGNLRAGGEEIYEGILLKRSDQKLRLLSLLQPPTFLAQAPPISNSNSSRFISKSWEY